MHWNRSIRRAFSLILLGALCGMLFDLLRDDSNMMGALRLVQRPASVQTRDDAALLSGWLDQLENGWEVGKNHAGVKAAFEDVIAEARKSTVRIYSDGQQIAMGTIVDKEGFILTKASEVENRQPLQCQFHDRRKRKATVVGSLPEYDLVMLKVEASQLKAVEWNTDATPLVGSLLATPHLGREPLAVGVVSVTPQRVRNDGILGVRLHDSSRGAAVSDVIPHTAAEEAGMSRGDIVLRVGSEAIESSDEFVRIISDHLPGDTVKLAIQREEEEVAIEATLGRRTEMELESGDFQSFLGGELSFRRSGFPQVLQHDTFLLPHHCGGPLVDLDGKVVGINIARAERIASYAVPSAVIVAHLESLKEGERRNDALAVSRSVRAGKQDDEPKSN
jgi:serine protease Do